MKKTRKLHVIANKYQKEIILLAFIPSALMFLSFICVVFISNPTVSQAVFHTSFLSMKNSVNQLSGIIVFLMCSFFLLSLIGALVISHNMVGSYERIARDLDEIIAGRSQKMIDSRRSDTLIKDLLKRINVLVGHYVKHEKKNS